MYTKVISKGDRTRGRLASGTEGLRTTQDLGDEVKELPRDRVKSDKSRSCSQSTSNVVESLISSQTEIKRSELPRISEARPSLRKALCQKLNKSWIYPQATFNMEQQYEHPANGHGELGNVELLESRNGRC